MNALPQNGSLSEPERFSRVDDDVVEVGEPGIDAGHVEQVGHDGVSVPLLGVGQQEGLGADVEQMLEQLGQPINACVQKISKIKNYSG